MGKSFSLRTQLMLMLGTLVLTATASLGSIAYNALRTVIEQSLMRDIGAVANARKTALIRFLTEQRIRSASLLKTASALCAPDEIRCLRRVLSGFAATEGASGVALSYRKGSRVVVGDTDIPLLSVSDEGAIARFGDDRDGKAYYLVSAIGETRDGEMTIALRIGLEGLTRVFLERNGLGRSSEIFLTDHNGRLVTSTRYSGSSSNANGVLGQTQNEVMRQCLAGESGEILGRDYRGATALQAYRSVPEVGGGCIVALIDQAEAFAPTRKLRRDVATASIILGLMAISLSFLIAQIVAHPIDRLGQRARSLQEGDFDSPVPRRGPAEIQTFADTFAAMAASLRDSRVALEKSSEQVRDVLESIGDSFIACDHDWRCTYVNQRALSLARLTRGELVGKNLQELLFDHLSVSTRSQLIRSMENRVEVHCEELFAPTDCWFEVYCYPSRDGLAIFARDETERKLMTERLQQTQKLESLGVLAGGIAHDFNNLLTGIMAGASVAREQLTEDHPLQSTLDDVLSAAERAAILTRQLLAYAGKGQFVIQPLNLSQLVRDLSPLLRTSIPKTVTVELDLAADLPAVEGDSAQIQQLIMNLVINGAEAIGAEQMGTVRVVTQVRNVDAPLAEYTFAGNEVAPGQYVVLEVYDDGSGMDEATTSRIFDPFFTTKFAGRGLGLAAALGIVRGHHGALRVQSSPGNGSTFEVIFPVGDAEAAPRLESRTRGSGRGSGTILVIDDEETARQAARVVLEHHGYAVVLAEDGRKGVESLRRLGENVSLALLDMTMPVMSGEQTLEALQKVRPDLPVILTSGYDQSEAARRFVGKRIAGFIQKPFTSVGLAEHVRAILAK